MEGFCLIFVLLIALWFALRCNHRANKKARHVELHKLLPVSSRQQLQQEYRDTPINVYPSSGYPGMSSIVPSPAPAFCEQRGNEGYHGFLAWQKIQQQVPQLHQFLSLIHI